jgi:hypothetical protein
MARPDLLFLTDVYMREFDAEVIAVDSYAIALIHIGDEVVFASLHGERYANVAVEMAVDLAEQEVSVSSGDA